MAALANLDKFLKHVSARVHSVRPPASKWRALTLIGFNAVTRIRNGNGRDTQGNKVPSIRIGIGNPSDERLANTPITIVKTCAVRFGQIKGPENTANCQLITHQNNSTYIEKEEFTVSPRIDGVALSCTTNLNADLKFAIRHFRLSTIGRVFWPHDEVLQLPSSNSHTHRV